MIRALLLTGDACVEGDASLVDRWRAEAGARLWLDIEGEIGPTERELLEVMGCEPLAIADCQRQRHPPKIEHFDESTFILFRGIASLNERLELEPQQVGIWVGATFFVTVHRGSSVSVEHFWSASDRAQLLCDPAYLALRFIHYASGRYLEKVLEFEDQLAELEDSLLQSQSEQAMVELVLYRSRLRRLRRIFSYHKVLAENLWLAGNPHLGEGEERQHLRRDVYDRCERLYSLASMYYELCGDLVEGYISISSHKLNQTMKILTIISAIFVPLTFIAGIYGMNFEYMPELRWKYAYFALLTLMGCIALALYLVFRRIKWL